jgi:dCTP deaminase
MSVGVLNKEQIKTLLIDTHRIRSDQAIKQGDDDYSSIDLPLGNTYYEMSASCRPRSGMKVRQMAELYGSVEQELKLGTEFQRNNIYLVKLAWSLDLPENVYARATAKSSIGRLDSLVRLVADDQSEFDRIGVNAGHIELYVEVVPITFNLIVNPGMSLSQIRFIKGPEDLCTLSKRALEYEDSDYLVHSDTTPAPYKTAQGDDKGILLSLETSADAKLGFTGFEGIEETANPIDSSLRGDAAYDPTKFWNPLLATNEYITIKRNHFYIFRSKERFKIPAHLAVECQAYSESLGDIRIHYAGFAHPFFGANRANGTPLIFEVRGHNMDTILRNGDPLAKVYFWKMSHPAELGKAQGKTEYNDQELKLSGCFKEWKSGS